MRSVTLYIQLQSGKKLEVQMPAAIQVAYAAMRAAEALGYPPDEGHWRLVRDGQALEEGGIVEGLDQGTFMLASQK